MRGGIYVLNFYSAVFVDQLKRGRKTATIRLGDKSGKYERGQVVWVTVGFRHSPREKIFTAVIDDVEVKQVAELSRRDIEHDNPEFRRLEETIKLPRADLQPPGRRRRPGHGDPLLADRRAAARRTSATGRRRTTTEVGAEMAEYAFLTTWLLESPREPVWEAIHDQARWPSWWRGVEEAEELQPAGDGGGVGTRLADGLEEPAALPGRVRGDDDPGRAPAPAGGPRRRRAGGDRPLAPLRAGRRHRGPLRVERARRRSPG